jgi:DNA-binding GntR family transcriptional regulator
VLRLTRARRDDDRHPVVVEEVVLALKRFPGLAANGGDVPDIVELAQRHGLSLGRATERLSIVRATQVVASHLQIAPDTDVLRLNRIVETLRLPIGKQKGSLDEPGSPPRTHATLG